MSNPDARRGVTLALVGLLALLVSGCADNEGADVSEDPTPAPVEEATWNDCTNPAGGYRVEYPADWHTNTGDGLDACQAFDADPVDLPDQPRDVPLDLPIVMRVESVPFETVTGEDRAAEVVDTRELEIDGHRAVRQELVATGGGLVPEDTAFTRYAVDRDGQTLLAQTFDIGDPPYARTVQVLDEMMSSLEFLGES